MSGEMNDLTPREIRLCRDAVVKGAAAVWHGINTRTAWEGAETLAARLYPMPTVEVTRVVRAGDFDYRVIDGRIECRAVGWNSWSKSGHTTESVRILADLLATPTHSVPADEVTT